MNYKLLNYAEIHTRTVGQAFGCEAMIVRHGRAIYTTRVYPFGQVHNARHDALEEAGRLGLVQTFEER